MKIFKEFTFEAAHSLPLVPKNHKCSKLHGHSFRVRVNIEGPLNEMGWVMDFSELKEICSPHINELDHSFLNDVVGLDNPTSENIAIWLWEKLKDPLRYLSSIEVMETCNSGCEYFG
ncbi:6-carboxytetrahydropterin synthase QueD [Gammaproteobacteria bacterium]|jgi:6-pyruvoyltetrahydropterin/6-carboxytetrahydropterin synthase|nr:6-carboxytetrahydropterin synthase QueD [Gammaproteobacteria bacterium]|tara:strand:- start:126 stop:476 length:351 start_codon:yes stop_codon:yes gene_type:complete